MRTPRNNLPYIPASYQPKDYAALVDTLYEIADAELNSDKAVHDEWERLSKKYAVFTKSFIRFIKPRINAIAGRDQLRVFDAQVNTICERIYEDWEKTK